DHLRDLAPRVAAADGRLVLVVNEAREQPTEEEHCDEHVRTIVPVPEASRPPRRRGARGPGLRGRRVRDSLARRAGGALATRDGADDAAVLPDAPCERGRGRRPGTGGARPRGRAMKGIRTAALMLSLSLTGGTALAEGDPVHPLLSKDLAGVPGRELSMILVEYPPGASSPAHTHHAQAMVYVLEGSIVMQLKDQAPVTLTAGQTFYEGPDDVHLVSKNASSTAAARFVVFLAKDKSAPILKPLK